MRVRVCARVRAPVCACACVPCPHVRSIKGICTQQRITEAKAHGRVVCPLAPAQVKFVVLARVLHPVPTKVVFLVVLVARIQELEWGAHSIANGHACHRTHRFVDETNLRRTVRELNVVVVRAVRVGDRAAARDDGIVADGRRHCVPAGDVSHRSIRLPNAKHAAMQRAAPAIQEIEHVRRVHRCGVKMMIFARSCGSVCNKPPTHLSRPLRAADLVL